MSAYLLQKNADVSRSIKTLVECTTGLTPDDGDGNYGRAVDYVRRSIDAPHQYVHPTPSKVINPNGFFFCYLVQGTEESKGKHSARACHFVLCILSCIRGSKKTSTFARARQLIFSLSLSRSVASLSLAPAR